MGALVSIVAVLSSNKSRQVLSNLPDDIIFYLLKEFLWNDARSLSHAGGTCRHWSRLVRTQLAAVRLIFKWRQFKLGYRIWPDEEARKQGELCGFIPLLHLTKPGRYILKGPIVWVRKNWETSCVTVNLSVVQRPHIITDSSFSFSLETRGHDIYDVPWVNLRARTWCEESDMTLGAAIMIKQHNGVLLAIDGKNGGGRGSNICTPGCILYFAENEPICQIRNFQFTSQAKMKDYPRQLLIEAGYAESDIFTASIYVELLHLVFIAEIGIHFCSRLLPLK